MPAFVRACLLAVLSVGLLATTPAAAGAPLGPPQQIAPNGCLRSAISMGPDGVLRGFVQCVVGVDSGQSELRYVVHTPSGWQTRRILPWSSVLHDSTQDETGTYAFYGGDVFKVDRSGNVGPRRSITVPGRHVDHGSIVARGGKWWAVWDSGADGQQTQVPLYEAGTLLGQTPPRAITRGSYDYYPSLALRPGGGLVLVWARLSHDDAGRASTDVRLALNTGAGWQSRTLAVEAGFPAPQVATTDRHVFASWERGGRPVVASNESGMMRSRVLSAVPCPGTTRVAASGSTVWVAWNGCTAERKYEVYLAERRNGSWSTATAFSGSGIVVADLSPRAGKVTISGDYQGGGDSTRYRTYSRSQA